MAFPSQPPPLHGVIHIDVRVDRSRWHVATAGDPDAPPLVLLHGWPQHWWMWRRVIGPLAKEHRVYAPDLRGFGWSDAPPGGYDPEVFAADVESLLGTLGIEEPVDLVGHDWGGFTGFMLCLRAPERVRRFLALNVLHPFGAALRPAGLRHGWRFWYQWPLAAPAVLPGLNRLAGRVEPSLAWVGGRDAGWSEEEHDVFLSQFREPDRAMAAARLYRHAATKLLPDAVRGKWRNRRLEVPTRILFGDADRVQHPDLLRGYERNAPEMEIELVSGVGHFIVDEAPELVLDRARAFFAQRVDGG